MIHSIPHLEFYFDINEVFGYTRFGSDDLFTMLMLPRVYLLFRQSPTSCSCLHGLPLIVPVDTAGYSEKSFS